MDLFGKMQAAYRYLVKSPMLWGSVAVVGFYALIETGPLDLPIIRRYFAGHPVEYMETVFFGVGLAVLVLKAIDLAGQYLRLPENLLEPAPAANAPDEVCAVLLGRLEKLPHARQRDGYVRRLRAALEFVRLHGSSEGLDDELKYLADADATRIHNSYGLFRVIVWAIPILGFLGTVIGITMALNSVDLNAPDKSMVHVLTGLGLKFDTTALALSLSMLLMFLHFFVDRTETLLLDRVDARIGGELAVLLPSVPAGPDGQLLAVRRMAETVLQATEQLVIRQAELWQSTIDTAAVRWTQMSHDAGTQLQAALAAALSESLTVHARQTAAGESALAEKYQAHGEQLHRVQSQTLEAVAGLERTIAAQVEVLQRIVAATGDVTGLEDTLNRNLATLAGAQNFEETVLSLAAAVNLLSGRLSDAPAAAKLVTLKAGRKVNKAA